MQNIRDLASSSETKLSVLVAQSPAICSKKTKVLHIRDESITQLVTDKAKLKKNELDEPTSELILSVPKKYFTLQTGQQYSMGLRTRRAKNSCICYDKYS